MSNYFTLVVQLWYTALQEWCISIFSIFVSETLFKSKNGNKIFIIISWITQQALDSGSMRKTD